MSKSLERVAAKSLLSSKSTSGVVGKGLVGTGSVAIALSVVAAFIPFVGVLGLGILLVVLGALMWE